MPLNDRQIRNAKPQDKPYKLTDGGGLFLLLTPAGGKLWRFKYRADGKEKLLALGKYPEVSLLEAREAAQQAKQMLAQGNDPAAAKQAAKREKQALLLNTFERLAREWHDKNRHRWKPVHAARIMRYLETDVFPHIGAMPIDGIRVKHIKGVLDGISARGVYETAEKIRQWVGAVFNYAALLELADGNPAAPLQGYLPARTVTNMPALPRDELTEFYRRLNAADAAQSNKIGIMLLMLVFVRNTELRGAEWTEFDFERRIWTIPAHRMKRPRLHTVPLAAWTLELLHELHTITGHTPYLFPSRSKDGYISENTFGKIINNMGYKGIATPHGFRSLASSLLNERGFNPDAIERQLAHVEDNKIRAAYNRADYWNERADMMQWYADHLKRHFQAA